MRFTLSEEHRDLASAIDDIVNAAGGAGVARSWSEGDSGPGLALWRELAETGILGLRIPESAGGVGGSLLDLVVVFERLGFHAVPGPYLESGVLLPTLVPEDLQSEIGSGAAVATAGVEKFSPLAPDLDVSTHAFLITNDSIAPAKHSATVQSIDPARRLSRLTSDGTNVDMDPARIATAIDETTLACSAFLLGAGERMLDQAVSYAKIREQFGRPIGEYQAVKHALANVRVALTFVRPLVHAAAIDGGTPTSARSVSAAKVTANDAAMKSARTALQVHGAIGYTAESDLGLWLLRVRALVGVWGTSADHRARIARALVGAQHEESAHALRS